MPQSPQLVMLQGEVVYVIGAPSSNVVKIGTTREIERRLRNIQLMSPIPVSVLWAHPGDRELELKLHHHFARFRTHGEWFDFPFAPVRLIKWAVEGEPWNRTPVSLSKSAPIPARAFAPLRDGTAPLFRAVADHIRQEIARGDLPAGARVPARHIYAARFGVGVDTVKRACEELERIGLLQHSTGGFRVSS